MTACGTQIESTEIVDNLDTNAFQTEADYRRAIAESGNDVQSLEDQKSYYETLLAMDCFTEDDYISLAQIYGLLGDEDNQRSILIKLHRLYPSLEHAELISEVIVHADDADEQVSALLQQFSSIAESTDIASFSALISSETWKSVMQDSLVGVTRQTSYQGEKDYFITSDSFQTTLQWDDETGSRVCWRMEDDNVTIVTAKVDETGFQGDFSSVIYDLEGNQIRSVSGTMKDNICVGSIHFWFNGINYSGTCNEDGSTAETQIDEQLQVGNIIYAYSEDSSGYLYAQDTTLSDFHITADYLDLPTEMER
jgi:hypothetical protein